MAKEIRARFSKGVIEPLEKLELEEGKEIVISIKELPSEEASKDAFEMAAGGWAGTLDFDAYLKDLYASRRMQSPEVTI